ncbi:hypothetical protein RKD23_002984 [Streptomyces sp. SAI-170]
MKNNTSIWGQASKSRTAAVLMPAHVNSDDDDTAWPR